VASDDPRLTDPLTDPRRFAMLESLRNEDYRRLGRLKDEVNRRSGNRGEVGRPIARQFDLRRGEIESRRREERRRMGEIQSGTRVDSTLRYEIFSHLVSYLPPSLFALTLGASLRVEGRLSEARGLGTRMLADLRISRPGQGQIGSEWASARAELMIGSTYMDEDRPREAERHVLEAVRRLQALENSLVGQRARVEQGLGDPAGLEASIRQSQQMRANALLSLAVNANVRMGDPELALTYFEQAYELDQRDFMRVLSACYRARSGRAAEARAVLRGIKASPPLYYNLACTHALLGEIDEALDYLQRELIENHPSSGSLERQKAWAREDPDLQALREDPRFQRMVEAPRGP
jgi:tetratricopeptide (TPR) repeat protein